MTKPITILQHLPFVCWAASCGWPLDMHVVQFCASVSHCANRLHSSVCISICKCRGSIGQPNPQTCKLSFLVVLQLSKLYVHHNNLTGTLPDAWGNLIQASPNSIVFVLALMCVRGDAPHCSLENALSKVQVRSQGPSKLPKDMIFELDKLS